MTSEINPPYSEAYVWVWLPDATQPVVAGLLSKQGQQLVFNYGRSYLARQVSPTGILEPLDDRRLGSTRGSAYWSQGGIAVMAPVADRRHGATGPATGR